jgi:hypothetical protein
MNHEFDELVGAYSASIDRFNAIAARGPLNSAHIAHGCRMELKTTLRIARQLVAATRHDPELQACYLGMLKSLKRMHYSLIMVETCAVELATRHN